MGEDGLGDGQEPRSRFGGRGDGGGEEPKQGPGATQQSDTEWEGALPVVGGRPGASRQRPEK